MLNHLRAAAADQRPPSRLEHLLAAWRVVPAREIAALVDETSRACREGQTPLDGDTAHRKAAWTAVSIKKSPADLERLVESLVVPAENTCVARLRALASMPKNPRLTTALLDAFAGSTVPASARRLWQALEEALMAAEDPRLLDAATIERLPAAVDRDRVRAGITEPRPLDGPERSALLDVAKSIREHALRAASVRERDAALRRTIYASPNDDGPRAVYADWLLTLGDPRGELINVQLARGSREPSRRELARGRALIAEHGGAWLGAAGRFITNGGARFERGFLAAAQLERHVPGKLSDDVWRTCVELDVSGVVADDAQIVALLDSDALAALESVVGAHICVFQRLATGAGPARLDALRARLRVLGGSGLIDDLATLDAVASAFPRLEELVWVAWADPARLLRHVLEGGLFARLRRVEHRWAAASKSKEMHGISLEHTGAGTALSVALRGRDAVGIHVAATLVAEVLDAIGARLAKVVVDVDPSVNPSVLAPLERVAARFRLARS